MFRSYIRVLLVLTFPTYSFGQLTVEQFAKLPEAVSNNAVCEGFIDDSAYLFSFGGIDTTKIYSGIHNRSYKINLASGASERISDLPDDRGKIASGVSRIDNMIYIMGGYYVNEDDT